MAQNIERCLLDCRVNDICVVCSAIGQNKQGTSKSTKVMHSRKHIVSRILRTLFASHSLASIISTISDIGVIHEIRFGVHNGDEAVGGVVCECSMGIAQWTSQKLLSG